MNDGSQKGTSCVAVKGLAPTVHPQPVERVFETIDSQEFVDDINISPATRADIQSVCYRMVSNLAARTLVEITHCASREDQLSLSLQYAICRAWQTTFTDTAHMETVASVIAGHARHSSVRPRLRVPFLKKLVIEARAALEKAEREP